LALSKEKKKRTGKIQAKTKTMKQRLIFILVLVSVIVLWNGECTGVFAEDVEVKASISADRIGLDDVLIYTVSFKGIVNPGAPDISHFSDFNMRTNSRSEEYRFINGVTSRYVKYQFYLTPRRMGKFRLPPVTYEYEGKQYRTQTFTVEVVKGSVAPATPRRRRPGHPFIDEDLFSSPFDRDRARPQQIDVRVASRASKQNVIKGEQVLFTILLYTRNRIRAVNMLSNQSIPGFWQEWYPMGKSIEGSPQVVNGKRYEVFEIRKAALFPTKSGIIAIPSLKFEITLQGDTFSLFPDTRRIQRTTPELTIDASDPPAGAEGLPVGRFTFDVRPNKRNVDINDILSLKIKITGTGNIKTINIPEFKSDNYFKVYPAKISRDISYGTNGVSGAVEAEIPVTFKKTGLISFPSLEFNYFDLDSAGANLVTLKSRPFAITVTGEKEKQESATTIPKTEIIKKGEDIEFIKKGTIYNQDENYYKNRTFTILLLIPFIINILLVFKLFVFDRFIVDSSLMKKHKLLNRTIKRLRNVRERGDISPILENYLKEKTGMGLSGITNQSIDQLLYDYGVGDSDIKTFITLKSGSESSRFSPNKTYGGSTGRELKHDVNVLIDILKRIDSKIK
jgi:hypothetical protein